MAKRASVRYVCSNCGSISAAWTGRCSVCGEWNTIQEEVVIGPKKNSSARHNIKSQPISAVTTNANLRLSLGNREVDLLVGGGVVSGSVILLSGQPGIGKSTLLLQLAEGAGRHGQVLYVSGEESAEQVAMRAERLNLRDNSSLQLAVSTDAEETAEAIAGGAFKLVIVDSIQTMSVQEVASAAGSISQINAAAQLFMAAAKQSNTAVILVGHVTKEGVMAGPKILEHLVDVVLQLEGESVGGFKVLRATKNRFGSTNEAAIFEMTDKGMQTVINPSAALLAERQITDGSVVLATLEGTRPLLVEVQALVNVTSYGYPKRTASGIDLTRVNLLVAVLERRTKLQLSDRDIYINIVGGIRLSDPAADLAVCMAIGSAAKGLKLTGNTVVFGEVGLSGEIRRVPFMDKRVAEAKKLGFTSAIGPAAQTKTLTPFLRPMPDIRTALNSFLKKPN